MKYKIFILLLLCGCKNNVLIRAEPANSNSELPQKYILVQIDSVAKGNSMVYFTPIKTYVNYIFIAISSDSTQNHYSLEFYEKLISNAYTEGNFSKPPRKIIQNEIYFVSINEKMSTENILSLNLLIDPNKLDLSKLKPIEREIKRIKNSY